MRHEETNGTFRLYQVSMTKLLSVVPPALSRLYLVRHRPQFLRGFLCNFPETQAYCNRRSQRPHKRPDQIGRLEIAKRRLAFLRTDRVAKKHCQCLCRKAYLPIICLLRSCPHLLQLANTDTNPKSLAVILELNTGLFKRSEYC